MDRRLIGIGLIALAALGILSLALRQAEPAAGFAAAPVEPPRAPERPVETARRAVDAEPEPANPRAPVPSSDPPTLPIPSHEAARLDVSVVQLDGLAVPFEMVVVAQPGDVGEWRAQTDAAGRAAIEVPSGIDLLAKLEAGARDTHVSSLAPGEARPVRIVADATLARVFYGRVVTAEDGSPIDNACVRLVGGPEEEPLLMITELWHLGYVSKDYESAVGTNLSGDFELVVPAREDGVVLVEALGRGPEAFLPTSRGTSAEVPWVVALPKEARLRGRVLAFPGGEATVRAQVSLRSLMHRSGDAYRSEQQVLHWVAGVSARGAFELSEMPANHFLFLHVLGDREVDDGILAGVVIGAIEAGEVREIEIELR